MRDERMFLGSDGREWLVTLEGPAHVMRVEPPLDRAGALVPEHEVRIFFRNGDDTRSAEYTALTALDDLSEAELERWLAVASSPTAL